jgi:hypothetical protein
MNIPLSAYIGSAVMTVCAPASRPISPAALFDFRWGMRNSYKGTTLPQRSAGRQIRPRLRSHRSESHDADYARRWRRRGAPDRAPRPMPWGQRRDLPCLGSLNLVIAGNWRPYTCDNVFPSRPGLRAACLSQQPPASTQAWRGRASP